MTTDVVNGGTITLHKVKLDWFFSEPDKENNFASIPELQETLAKYRDRAEYTEVKGLAAGYKSNRLCTIEKVCGQRAITAFSKQQS